MRWVLDSVDDVDLYDPAGLPLLVAAVDRPDCPKRELCCRAVEDYAVMIICGGQVGPLTVLEAAGAQAASGKARAAR